MTGPPPNWPYSSQAYDTYEYDRALDAANGITNLNGAAVGGPRFGHQDHACRREISADSNTTPTETRDGKITSCATPAVTLTMNIIGLLNVTRPLNEITTYTYNPTNGTWLTSITHHE